MRNLDFEDINNLKRINLNLSSDAEDIINKDIIDFMHDDTKYLSTFLNIVFTNFYEEANASLVTKSEIYENKLRKTLNIKRNEENNTIAILKNAFLNDLAIEISNSKSKKKTQTYKKETKFKLNNENYNIITKSNDLLHPIYKQKERIYLNALFEEYTKLTSAQRESIYFKQYIDILNISTKVHKCMISIYTKNKKTIIINPYAIYTDSTNTSTYLVGTTDKYNNVIVFRLKNILSISFVKNSEINKTNFDTIDQLIKERGIANVNGQMNEYKIKLTQEGIKNFNITLNMRPKVICIENDIYTFNSTDFQMTNYFFKFGSDALVISPESLKIQFETDYEKALGNYKKRL